jgi:hypothetical protein
MVGVNPKDYTHDPVCTIESTRDRHALGPACLIRWGGKEWYAPVEDVRQTAEDLFMASAFADMIRELLAIDLPTNAITALASKMLTRTVGDRRKGHKGDMLGCDTTIDLMPAGSSKRQVGFVVIR